VRDLTTILVTGAGAPGIRGTLYCLEHNFDRAATRIIVCDMRPDPVGRYFAANCVQLPAPESPDYIGRLLEICRREAVDAILPQTTREIVALSRERDRLAAAGSPVAVGSPASIALTNDKWALMELFSRLHLPHPRSVLTRSETELVEAAHALGYPKLPVAVKPPVSNGMRGFRVLCEQDRWTVERFLSEKPSGDEITLSALLAILRRGKWPALMVSEFLPGPEYSVDAFIGQHLKVAVPRVRQSIRSGITFESRTDFRPDLVDYTLRAAETAGLTLAFGFQFKLDDAGVPKVLECNPRVQGTMVASLFAGANLPWLAVREVLGYPVKQLEPLQDASFYRYWGGVGVAAEGAHEI